MTSPYSTWVPELRVHIRGAEDDFLQFEVAATVRDYYNQSGSGAWRVPVFQTVADQDLYPLTPPDGAVVLYISSVWRNNRPLAPATMFDESQRARILNVAPDYFDHPSTNTFQIVGGPIVAEDDIYLETRLGVASGMQTEWYSSHLKDKHYDDILTGALARLHALPDKPWTNEKLARYYLKSYMQMVAASREDTMKRSVYRETPFAFPGGWR